MEQESWVNFSRCPMKKDGIFRVANWIIRNEDEAEEVGYGSSCLVYHGEEGKISEKDLDKNLERRVIVKEFYPKSVRYLIDVERQEDGRLKISDKVRKGKDFAHYKEQFFQGFYIQKKLSNSNAMEIVVKPLSGIEEWGDSYYIISDIHRGEDLSKVKFESLQERLKLAIKISEVFSILHKEKYIMLDIKPENFMWIEEPGAVKILDKDSILSLEENHIGKIFFNEQYMAPEIGILRQAYDEEENTEILRKQKRYLKESVDVYALGIYFLEIFFERLPEKEQLGKAIDLDELLYEFNQIYRQQLERVKLEQAGKSLIEILKNMMINMPSRRWKIDKVQQKLEQIYFLVASEHLVPRKQYAKANASFAAYNLLQKYPLFKYGLSEKDGRKEINVALFGSHAMRREMLSALISIGQMIDTKLNIYVVSEDVEQFWDSYPAAGESHKVFESAVLWEKQDGTASNTFDRQLVSEPLASIHLINSKKWGEDISDEKNSSTHTLSEFCKEYSCSYFIFMCEEMEENKELLHNLSICKNENTENIFAAYLSEESDEGSSRENKEDRKNSKKVTESIEYKENIESCESAQVKSFPVSTSCFSEKYNEDMFKAKIYQMGLMAHLYYSGYMVENEKAEQKTQVESVEKQMKKIEKNFRQDVYNIASSERCALHGIYKMASLGISPDRPGKILKYFHQIEKEEVRNQLAYLEHLSWTAYMLTSGVLPATVETMDTYAYKKVSETGENNVLSEFNDWKEKKEGKIVRHPLLVAAGLKRGLPKKDWDSISQEEKDSLDELDKVSYEIYLWYKKNKARFYQEFKDAMKELNTTFKTIPDLKQKKEIQVLLKQLEAAGENCIEKMCQEVFSQDKKNVDQCKDLIENIKNAKKYVLSSGDLSKWESVIKNVENVQYTLKPVFDSYKDRDFKQADENLVWASLDLLG